MGAAMTGGVLSDEQIAAMTPAQRRDLIRRLQRPVDDMRPAGLASLLRRTHLGLMAGGAFFMVPWIVYLSITLPPSYLVRNWTVTWVGFDTLLVGFMVATAVLAWLHRQMLVFFAFTTGILLVCDAWFDVMTSDPGDRRAAVLTAVLGGLPLATILIAGALSIVRLNAVRLWQLTPDQTLWRLPLLP